jgi:hypothetical protein
LWRPVVVSVVAPKQSGIVERRDGQELMFANFIGRPSGLLVSDLGVQVNLTRCDLNVPRPFLAGNRDLDQVVSGREGDVRGRIPEELSIDVDLASARR